MPDPALIRPIGLPFIELQSVDSTNNYARKHIKSVEQQPKLDHDFHGTTWFAFEQTEGRGQRGKKWTSAPGLNIAMSIAINPHFVSVTNQFHLNACIAVSVAEFFLSYAGADTHIKWPNDLYWQDRKAGGILIENSMLSTPDPATSWQWSIVGIGINVNQTSFPEWLPNPVSLKQITGKTFEPVLLAQELCSVININFNRLHSKGFDQLLDRYNQLLYQRGQKIKLRKATRVFEGTLIAVSSTGKMVIDEGILTEYDFGELEWIT